MNEAQLRKLEGYLRGYVDNCQRLIRKYDPTAQVELRLFPSSTRGRLSYMIETHSEVMSNRPRSLAREAAERLGAVLKKQRRNPPLHIGGIAASVEEAAALFEESVRIQVATYKTRYGCLPSKK